jgi:hypothetical protein
VLSAISEDLIPGKVDLILQKIIKKYFRNLNADAIFKIATDAADDIPRRTAAAILTSIFRNRSYLSSQFKFSRRMINSGRRNFKDLVRGKSLHQHSYKCRVSRKKIKDAIQYIATGNCSLMPTRLRNKVGNIHIKKFQFLFAI